MSLADISLPDCQKYRLEHHKWRVHQSQVIEYQGRVQGTRRQVCKDQSVERGTQLLEQWAFS